MFAIDFGRMAYKLIHIVRSKESLPMPTDQIQDYLEYIQPLKAKLDTIKIQ